MVEDAIAIAEEQPAGGVDHRPRRSALGRPRRWSARCRPPSTRPGRCTGRGLRRPGLRARAGCSAPARCSSSPPRSARRSAGCPASLVPVNIARRRSPSPPCCSCWTYRPSATTRSAGASTSPVRCSWRSASRSSRSSAPCTCPARSRGSSALYGSIGVVFATLAWLAIYARLIVLRRRAQRRALRGRRRHGHRGDRGAADRGRGAAHRHPRRRGGRARRARRTSHADRPIGPSRSVATRLSGSRRHLVYSAPRPSADVTIDSDGPGRDGHAGTSTCTSRSGGHGGTGDLRALGALRLGGPAGPRRRAPLHRCARRHRPHRRRPDRRARCASPGSATASPPASAATTWPTPRPTSPLACSSAPST